MPHADVGEYRRVELSRKRLLYELHELGFTRWLVVHYSPRAGFNEHFCLYPQDVAEAAPDAWERQYRKGTFDANLIHRSLSRQGYRCQVQRTAGLPYVRVLGDGGEDSPWPAESDESWVSERIRDNITLIGVDDPMHPEHKGGL